MKYNRIKKIIKLIVLYILSIFITFVIEFDPTLLSEGSLISAVFLHGTSCLRYSILSCFVVSLIIYPILYCSTFSYNKNVSIKVLGAVLFAITQTMSIIFYYFYSVIYTFNHAGIIFYGLLCVAAYGTLFYSIENACFLLFDKMSLTKTILRRGSDSLEKHIGVLSFIFIMLCWLPWLIIYYPGSMWFDMCYQLEQYYFGNYSLHPVFATLCMGVCLDIGKHFFSSDNIGIFIYILLQSTICAFAFSRVIRLFRFLNVPKVLSVIALAYYGISPIFGAYMQIGTKDVVNCGLFVLFTVQIVYLCTKLKRHESTMSFSEVVSLFITSTLCSLYRKEMIILCTVTLAALMIICIKEKVMKLLKRIASVVAGVLIAYVFFDAVVVKLLLGGTFIAGSAEAFSIPLQQVARFVYYEGDLVSEEEKDVLDNCFYYGYDEIAGNYNPYLADPIKYNVWMTEQLGEVWLSLFAKRPLVYFEATVANSFGYYSIIPALPSTVNGAPTNGTPGSRFEFYINRDPDRENQMVMISYVPIFEAWRNRLSAYAYNLRNIPVVNLIYSLGFYTWGGIILILYILKDRKEKGLKRLIAFLPFILGIGVCIASPVNDCLRYFLPVIANLPIMVGWTVSTKSSAE